MTTTRTLSDPRAQATAERPFLPVLILLFVAGLGLNSYSAASIYAELMEYRTFPEGLFTGDPDRLAVLRDLMDLR